LPAKGLADLDERGRRAVEPLERAHRAERGQFFTPASIARYMASLLDVPTSGPIRVLDPGAGIGALTAAAAERMGKPLEVICYEAEPRFQEELKRTLAGLPNVTAMVEVRDFIAHAAELVKAGGGRTFTHAILNPPYKKIGSQEPARRDLQTLGLKTSNLYAGFFACAIALSELGAQAVGIMPRSFMNGLYFKPFRRWLLDRVAIAQIHVFDRRDSAFASDEVLQENVILKVVVGGRQDRVTVTTCRDASFAEMRIRTCAFSEVVPPGNPEHFIHVPAAEHSGLAGLTLHELGLEISTGPVVDFRLREHLRMQPEPGTVPLLYPGHFRSGTLQWPGPGSRPNAIVRNVATERWLWPRGCYVVLRRLSSKEEKRRVVAYLLEEDALTAERVGFENHLNVIHCGRRGLPPAVARGLAAYLNSQAVDDYFRTFSGQTQVNATDLRHLRYPKLADLEACRY